MADLTVSAAIDTLMGSADIAAIRTNIGLAAVGAGESLGWTDALLSRLAANSFGLGGRLSITAPANASALSSTGYSLTGSDATSMIDLAGTLNTSGSPAIIKVALTNTNSGANTKFASFLAGAGGTTEVFSVQKDGRVYSEQFDSFVSTNRASSYGRYGIYLSSTASSINFYTGTNASGTITGSTILLEDANKIGIVRSTNAQTFNVYNTYTSGSVYERGFMRWASNVLEIGTEHVGASARDMALKVPSGQIVQIDKTTEDNGFINFQATADADATSAISTLTTSGAVTHHIQIQINGVTAWIPCSTTDPS